MNLVKVGFLGLLAAVALLAARAYLKEVEPRVSASAQSPGSGRSGGARGFVQMPLPDGLPGDRVVIFAPADCPSAAAQRADALARHLDRAGIPYQHSQEASFSHLASREEADRVAAVMQGGIPVVFVRSRARANPAVEEVVAEYRAGGMR